MNRLLGILGLIASACLTCALVSCRQVESPPPPIRAESSEHHDAVAVVAGTPITKDAVEAELRRRFGRTPVPTPTREQKLDALEGLVRQEALYAQAKASGFEQSPELQARIKNLVVTQFREKQFKATNAAVSEAEIQAAYHADDRFNRPVVVRGATIFLKVPKRVTAEKRAAMRARAEAVLAEAQAASDDVAFAQLVARHSEDSATRYRAGDTGWMTRPGGDDAVLFEALLAVGRPGAFAPVTETPHGFYVARLTEKREGSRVPLAEARETIRYQLSRQKAEQAEHDFYARMKSGLAISVDQTLLDAISLPADAADTPPSVPGAMVQRH